ncbi:MAG TPA: sigma-70 family RNA polymerase sigma factor [Terriglobales bacterium]|jgi:RNA polymerase sigma-70 factor (ECF subfamily)
MAVVKPVSSGSRGEAEERLLVQAAQKDPNRFGELYERNFHRIYAFIVRRVRERQVAEDLTSEVFQKALAALPGFDWRGIPFAAWLIRIASNVVTDQWKRTAREELTQDPPEQSATPDFEDYEQKARLFEMVDTLPAEQRRVILLRFAEEKSIRDIAQELKRSEGAVKQLQFRGLQTLRSKWGGKNG